MDYRVQAGDTLSSIARRFDLTLAALVAANPQLVDPDKIFPNELVHVPSWAAGGHHPGPVPLPAHVVTYVVQARDTLSSIAHAHNVSLTALIAANPQLPDPSLIHPGDVVNISGGPTPAQATTNIAAEAALALGSVSFAPYTGGGDVTSWTTEACRVLGLPSRNWIAGYQVLCARESSGLANAVNTYDSNAHGPLQTDHHPLYCSRGVAQCIPPTFASYHASGTSKSIYDPVANIAASMHYVMSRYGVRTDGSNLALEVQQADPNRGPMGY